MLYQLPDTDLLALAGPGAVLEEMDAKRAAGLDAWQSATAIAFQVVEEPQ